MSLSPLNKKSRTPWVVTALFALILLAGCGGAAPTAAPTATPTPEPTATPMPTATPTPEPTATPEAVEETADSATASDAPAADATAVPTPEVTIGEGFTVSLDEERGYSLALPSGWTELDLRGSRVQTLASTFGLADQLGPLNDFLASPEGDAIGILALSDLGAVVFGGLPTLLNVSVIDAPGATPDMVVDILANAIEANAGALGDVTIRNLDTTVINNIPGVEGSAIADLSQVGMDATLFVKVVGLIANDKIYVLTQATEESKMADRESDFDQIIATFRPE